MIELPYEQGSDEWLAARVGLPTASRLGSALTPKGLKPGAGMDSLVAELIAEGVAGAEEVYVNQWMARGIELEPEARGWYEFDRDVEVRVPGLCLVDDGTFGASPDGLVGDCGGVEIKCPKPQTHVKWFLAGEVPPEHLVQCYSVMDVCGLSWLDFISYCPGFEPLVVRCEDQKILEQVRAGRTELVARLAAARDRLFKSPVSAG